MRVESYTDVGTVRTSNQDSCDKGLFSPYSAWCVVCDGMGGANGGNVASAIATEKIREFIVKGFDENMGRENIKAMMLNAVSRANYAIYQRSLKEEALHGMGTTVVLMLATKGLLHVVHVGDSRAYLFSGDEISQLTMDHSYVQDLVNFGQITQKEARVHPQRNIITRVLGVHEEVQADYSFVDFSEGDLALACSDGLSNYMEEDTLLEYIERYRGNEERLAKELVGYVVQSGGSDNITVAVLNHG